MLGPSWCSIRLGYRRVLSIAGENAIQTLRCRYSGRGIRTVEQGLKHITDLGPQLNRKREVRLLCLLLVARGIIVGLKAGAGTWDGAAGGGRVIGRAVLRGPFCDGGSCPRFGLAGSHSRHDLAGRQPGQRLLVCVAGTDDAGSAAFRAHWLGAVTHQAPPPALPALRALGGFHTRRRWVGASAVRHPLAVLVTWRYFARLLLFAPFRLWLEGVGSLDMVASVSMIKSQPACPLSTCSSPR